MYLKIREAKESDLQRLEEILVLNEMLSFPDIDGIEAMKRVISRMGKYFLIAEIDKSAVGMIRGVYDGSRALIHQLSVHPDYKNQGVGKTLVKELRRRFNEEGVSTVSVTVGNVSKGYFEHLGFSEIPVSLMLYQVKD